MWTPSRASTRATESARTERFVSPKKSNFKRPASSCIHVVLGDLLSAFRVELYGDIFGDGGRRNDNACRVYSHMPRVALYLAREVQTLARIRVSLVYVRKFRNALKRAVDVDGESLLAE